MAQVRIRGIRQVTRNIKALARTIANETAGFLKEEGEQVITAAKENYVPVDTGTLRASGRAQLTRRRSDLSVEMSFGSGAAQSYAIPVHEIPRGHRVGRDKYLEIPAGERTSGLKGRYAERIKGTTGI